MTEVIEINGNTIIHGDCMKTSVLVHYAEPDFSYIKMGAVITDPPYGIGFKKYDSFDDSPEGYEEFIGKFVSLINRMIDGRPVFIWQSLKNIHRFHEWFPEGHRIFAGCKAFVSFKPGADIQWSWDPIVFWGKFPGEPSVVKKDSFTQRVPNFGGGRRSINHPCPTPGQIAEYIMDISHSPGTWCSIRSWDLEASVWRR